MNPVRAFLARMEPVAAAAGGVGFRTVYFTGVENNAWSEERAEALEMSIAQADEVGPKVGGVRCLVDDGPEESVAVEREHQERLARQGLD